MVMRSTIDHRKTYWAHFNRFELQLPGQCVLDCSAQGSVDDVVAYWAERVTKTPDPNSIRFELAEYGAWDDNELADDDANWRRLIWIAAGNVAEDPSPEIASN